MIVEEWLGEDNQLGKDILEKKYFYQGKETLDHWFDRISGGDPDFRRIVVEKKFLPGGRILAHRGIPQDEVRATYSNCFSGDVCVLTKTGYKRIDSIKRGEIVMTHDGTWQKVNEVMCREYSGDLYKISGKYIYGDIICTPNHKFQLETGEWKEIKDINIKGSISRSHKRDVFRTLPNLVLTDEFSEYSVDITEGFVMPKDRRFCKTEADGVERVSLESYCNSARKEYSPVYTWRKPKSKTFIKKNLVIDNDFCYFIGRWLGDGSITKRKNRDNPSIFQIVFNATTEEDCFNRCKQIGEEKFGIKASWRKNSKQNTLILKFESEIISTWFFNNFGHYCDGKYISNSDPVSKNIQTLIGLIDSDGGFKPCGGFKLTLKNSNLINWARETLFSIGVNVSTIKKETRQVADTITCTRQQISKLIPSIHKIYSDDRLKLLPTYESYNTTNTNKTIDISIIKDQSIKVYNLSVENSHSYVVNGLIAHNCYVLGTGDSIEEIYKTCSDMARTYSLGGGVGVDISPLRPRGAIVHNSAKETTGAVSFMKTFDVVTETIGQSGRRGALMLSIDIRHPDVEEFVDIKRNTDQITHANISVRVNDEFMKAVEEDRDYLLHWPCNMDISEKELDAVPEYGKLVHVETECGPVYLKKIKAKNLFMRLAENNWDYAEPGILYWDRISNWNMMANNPDFEYAGVNPCKPKMCRALKKFIENNL